MKICFVCQANICRSFVAQQLLQRLLTQNKKPNIDVISRGIYTSPAYAVPDKIKNFLAQKQILPQAHTPVLLSKQDLAQSDLVLVMTQEQWDFVFNQAPQFTAKYHLLAEYALGQEQDIEDPISLTGKAFDRVMTQLEKAVFEVYRKITRPDTAL
ncbi:arsenate reductase/protein-tyrosine-phosphatase family protein [Candidatus Avelusimicrobium sp.]